MTEPKPFIELSDFPALTPFSAEAIRGYMARGELVEGEHFHRMPTTGKRLGKPVFEWAKIEEWIRARSRRDTKHAVDVVPLRRRA